MRGPTYAFFCCISLLATTSPVWAGEKEACLAASDQGQRSRASGKLTEAKEKFAICAREVCPPVVRQDCAGWQDEVAKSLPTVNVGVRDQDGHDLLDVRISVDGQLVTEHLDGKSFPVDPGTHVFRAEDGTHPPVEERVLVKEGEKSRSINLRIVTTPVKSVATPGANPQDTPPPASDRTSSRSPLPFVLIGVGAAAFGTGLALHFVGKGSFPENCRPDPTKVEGRDGTCSPTPEDPGGEKSGEDAMSAVNLRNAGTALALGGGAVFLGGLVWFFVDTPTKSKATTKLLPSFGPGFAGLGLSGRF